LNDAWAKMVSNNPDIESKPKIIVGDLFKIIQKMENDGKEFSKFGFFPPKKNIEFAKKEKKPYPSARMFQQGGFMKM